MNTITATVQYAEGQTDDEGLPVGTNPFEVQFEWDGGIDSLEDSEAITEIAETGSVQFDWILLGLS